VRALRLLALVLLLGCAPSGSDRADRIAAECERQGAAHGDAVQKGVEVPSILQQPLADLMETSFTLGCMQGALLALGAP